MGQGIQDGIKKEGYHYFDQDKNFQIAIVDAQQSQRNSEVMQELSDIAPRSGVYLHLKKIDEKKGITEVYGGKAVHLQTRACNQSRLKKNGIESVILISKYQHSMLDESQIQHLEHLLVEQLKFASTREKVVLGNKQSVTPSIMANNRKTKLEEWFSNVSKKLKDMGVSGFRVSNNNEKGIKIEGKYTSNRKDNFFDCSEGIYYPHSGRVLICKGTIASPKRWQVNLPYQSIKTSLINSKILIKTKHEEKDIYVYQFTENYLCMGLTEATSIVMNKNNPKGGVHWNLKEENITLKQWREENIFK